jgi:hypothetical protein
MVVSFASLPPSFLFSTFPPCSSTLSHSIICRPPFYLELSLPTAGVRLKAVLRMNQWEWHPLRVSGSLLHRRVFLVSSGGAIEPFGTFLPSGFFPNLFSFLSLIFCFRLFTCSLKLSSRTHGGFICLLFAFFRNLRSYSICLCRFVCHLSHCFLSLLRSLYLSLPPLHHEARGSPLSFSSRSSTSSSHGPPNR